MQRPVNCNEPAIRNTKCSCLSILEGDDRILKITEANTAQCLQYFIPVVSNGLSIINKSVPKRLTEKGSFQNIVIEEDEELLGPNRYKKNEKLDPSRPSIE